MIADVNVYDHTLSDVRVSLTVGCCPTFVTLVSFMRIAIGYHFFAHYRAAVMQLLAQDSTLDVTFIADETESGGTIAPWKRPDSVRFVRARCYSIGPILFQPRLAWHILTTRYDQVILLGNAAWPAMWLAAFAARLRGARVHFWTHGWVKPESGFGGTVRSVFYGLAHNLLLYGHYAKCIGVGHGFAAERLHVIYNSLDADAQRTLRESISNDELLAARQKLFVERANLPLLVCSTRLMRVRRLDMLLDAMDQLKSRGLDTNLLLIGDGPEKANLSEQATRLGLTVHFYGACYDEPTLARLTMAADLTVAPGKVGLTAMQSLGYGTPVLTHSDFANQMPEWEAIIPGKTGDLFINENVDDLARVIERWFANAPDRQQVRDACFEMIGRFWNPQNQHRLIKRALEGLPADDLETALPNWNATMKEPT
jgi:glycosyltransferase involved in cell wall biosynthesis